jgi:hypothetical protein
VAHDHLTVADVLGMHTVLMQRYGGAMGVRDPGALEAALFRPQTGYYAYFSDRGRWFQRDRGRRFSAIVDALGCAQARV